MPRPELLSETTIKTWFDETAVVALEGNELILHCPNAFKRTNIQDRFLPNIEAGLKDIFSSNMTVVLLDDEGLRRRESREEAKPASIMDSGEFTFEKNSFWVSTFPATNWISSTSIRSASRYLIRKSFMERPERTVSMKSLINSSPLI